MKRLFVFLTSFFAFLFSATAQVDLEKLMYHPWVDSVFQSLSPDRRIAQLVWVDVTGGDDVAKQVEVAQLVKAWGVGGVIFFQSEPERLARLVNYYQSMAQTPLLVSMDAEWGVGMRLPGIIPFPYNMMMGASANPELIKAATTEMAHQMKRLGIQVSLAPACDINTQPLNPIIGMRAFGESSRLVTNCSVAYMQGLQANGILAVAKHYPGHGDTQTDSHFTLPLLPYSRQRLDSVELYPFRQLVENGIGAVMTAHLNVPELDPDPGIPSSLSSRIVENILRKEWNYKGLILTDAMNMQGAQSYGEPGDIEVKALKAGNDVVEFPSDPVSAIRVIKKAVEQNILTQEEIDRKCRRVLAAKLWAGLDHRQPVNTGNLIRDLNTPSAELAKRKLIEDALTLLENHHNLLPLIRLDTLKIATLSVGEETLTPFQQMLANFAATDHFNLREGFSSDELEILKKRLNGYNLVIAGIHSLYESKTRRSMQVGNMQRMRANRPYGVTDELEALTDYLSQEKQTVMVCFGSPYGLGELRTRVKPAGLIMAYQNDPLVQELAAQLIFGAIGARGKLPVTIGNIYRAGDGIPFKKVNRLKYTIPEEAGVDSYRLTAQIDSVVNLALEKQAFPGCNVLVAKDGNVIFHKAYGFHTYEKIVPSRRDDLYDLASVTKICGGLPAVMKLYDEGKIDPDQFVSAYFPDWKSRLFHPSNKSDITLRELYAHQSGLIPFLGFWKKTAQEGRLLSRWYTIEPDERHSLCVAQGIYLDKRFLKTVFRDIRKSPLKNRGKYVYSDLPFVITPRLVENVSGADFQQLLETSFYKPLGAPTLTYLPLRKFSPDRMVPTENDQYYRRQQLQGTVHDESAAVLGGISGNAGLFASANDLAKLMQMYLQQGNYGGIQFLKATTLQEFNRVQFPQNNNRRGLGFDKPLLNNQSVKPEDAYPTRLASPESFGHSGYTGTFVWADPACNLVYIFLSNRVFPTRNNNLISDLNIRTGIQEVIYRNFYQK